ncbi:hypothetical protein Zmor_012537 [Zophobas morio]|uniref:Uncharacterized protein n=2 Tax=Zophobas morio TaxID=2755281 RepID=A0AA38IG05_9CUCU|nr:hypothetical protein Zmor_012537 [Zophobas morio]
MVHSVKVPSVQDDYDFVEWLGMVALQGNVTDGEPDNYVTTYQTPEPNQQVGQIKFLQWRGFFTTTQIARFYNKLSEYRRNHNCDWVAMYVQGFSDSPIAWKGEEHHFYTNGDNSYTFVLTNDHVITFTQKCSRKRYNNKRKGKPL